MAARTSDWSALCGFVNEPAKKEGLTKHKKKKRTKTGIETLSIRAINKISGLYYQIELGYFEIT